VKGNALLGQSQAGNQEKLLQSSAVSAKRSGFSTVGVDGLMKAIGLSGAAFYSHFSSKDELFRFSRRARVEVKAWIDWEG
jgi:AcrR family transcriptional regulator